MAASEAAASSFLSANARLIELLSLKWLTWRQKRWNSVMISIWEREEKRGEAVLKFLAPERISKTAPIWKIDEKESS